MTKYPWLHYDAQTQTASCIQPKCTQYYHLPEETNRSTWTYRFEKRLFDKHEKTKNHFTKAIAVTEKGQKTLVLPRLEDTISDDALWLRIQGVWWLAKENMPIHKFNSYLKLQLARQNQPPPKSYKNDKSAWEIMTIIGSYFRRLLKGRIHKSPFYGIMVDETTDNSTTQRLIIYIKFLDVDIDGGFFQCVEYLDLVSPLSGQAVDITVVS